MAASFICLRQKVSSGKDRTVSRSSPAFYCKHFALATDRTSSNLHRKWVATLLFALDPEHLTVHVFVPRTKLPNPPVVPRGVIRNRRAHTATEHLHLLVLALVLLFLGWRERDGRV